MLVWKGGRNLMAIDLYFAGTQCKEAEQIIEENAYCRLYSYLNDKKNLADRFARNAKGKLIVDSGAFTAWTKGAQLNVDEYINWLNANKEHIYLAGQVDSIPGKFRQTPTVQEVEEAAQKTYDNYWYMRERLDNPDMLLYTFHVGEPFRFLEQVLQHPGIKYIALGGMVGKNEKTKENFSQRCFEIIQKSKNPNVKVHAFGVTTPSILQKFPFASGDSTGWIMTGSSGQIYSKYGQLDFSQNSRNTEKSVFNLSPDAYQIVVKEVERFGYTMTELEESYKCRMCYNIKYLYELSQQLKSKQFKAKKRLF